MDDLSPVEKRHMALTSLKMINDLLSPSYILDEEGRERLNILQDYLLRQLADKEDAH